MTPKVSVIIPTYNRRDLVEEAVRSVLIQDFNDLELIVVDDGSVDGTAEILKKYPVLRYFYQENQGVSHARNQGIQQARGELVGFLDSDDLWEPRKLSIQVAVMEQNHHLPLSYTDEIWIRRGKRVNPKLRHQKYSGWIFARCLPLCIISPSSVLIRRNVFENVGGFDETLPVCEDYDLWLRIAARYPVQFIAKKLIVKRGGHADQLSQRFWGNDRFRVQALEKIVNLGILSDQDRSLAIGTLIEKSRILENGFQKRQKWAEALYYQSLREKYQPCLPT